MSRSKSKKQENLGDALASGEALRLQNQLCFPLYAASRLMMQLYKPHLGPLGLTYPQYLILLVLWEEDGLSVKDIGQRIHLDSATVVQVLSNLERQGLIERRRAYKASSEKSDGRLVLNHLSPQGHALKEEAKKIPFSLSCEFGSQLHEIEQLRPLLFDLVQTLSQKLKPTP